MPNYLKIQGDVDKKLRKNGILFELRIPQTGSYDPTTGNRIREFKTLKVYGVKIGSEIKSLPPMELGFNDYILMLSSIDEGGDSYDIPPKEGSKILINGREVEIVDTVMQLNLTNVPLFYKVILRNI